MPMGEDIGKAYEYYYTHSPQISAGRIGIRKKIYRLMKRGYLAAKFGYFKKETPVLLKIFGKLLYFFPMRRSAVETSVRFLSAIPHGRVLDVGCGSGDWLLEMRDLGWQPEGIDFDPTAVQIALRRGLTVCCGSLEQRLYPAESFDAITLFNVIEHVPDPLETIAECLRLLKVGGRLVMVTPNVSSFGHWLFQQNWRGLEPPRHLFLLTPKAMRGLLQRIGITKAVIRTLNSDYVLSNSLVLHKQFLSRDLNMAAIDRCLSKALEILEQCLLNLNGSVGECMLTIVRKA